MTYVVTIEVHVDLDAFNGEQLDEIHAECHGVPCDEHGDGPVDSEWPAEEIALEARRWERGVDAAVTSVKAI